MDRIASRRGVFVHEVMALPPEALSMEIACLQEHDHRKNRAVKHGALPVVVIRG